MTLNWDIEVFDFLSSTQDICKARALDGETEGLVIQALRQNAGKGRHGRKWVSGKGDLTFSFILRPVCDIRLVGQLAILTGVALAKAIGQQAQLKWPNDVMLNNQKCAGILVDSDLQGQRLNWLVVGIGINTRSVPAIKGAGALGVDRDALLQKSLDHIALAYKKWQEQGFAFIRQDWLARTYEKGTALNVGIFEDLDDLGNLVVRGRQNEIQTISAGDVYLRGIDYAAGY